MGSVTPNFTVKELACPCCGACEMDEEFMRKAQVLRDIVDFPLVPVSGYRCRKYNASLRGAAERSQHPEGRAIDFRVRNLTGAHRYLLIKTAFLLGFEGIGIGKKQFHIDGREGPQVSWGY